MISKKFDIDPADVDADGIAESQTPLAAGNLTLDGALADLGTAAVFDVSDSDSAGIKGRIIAITSGGNDSGRTFTITGTDPEGGTQTEAVTGPNTTTVLSAKYFQTVTSIAVDAATAGAITIGTSNATRSLCTAAVALNRYSNYAATLAIHGTAGTYVADTEQTLDSMRDQTSQDVNWLELQADAAADAALTKPAVHANAVRMHLDSYTNGAELQFHVAQS